MMKTNKIEYWSAVGDVSQVREAIEAGHAVNDTSEVGYTPLHAAAENDRVEVVRLLLEHGGDPSARVSSGETPFDLAERSGHADIALLLKTAMSRPC